MNTILDPHGIKKGDLLRVRVTPPPAPCRVSPLSHRPIESGEVIEVIAVYSHPDGWYVTYRLGYIRPHGTHMLKFGVIMGEYLGPTVCRCNLMVTGCVCGVFQREQAARNG